MIWILSQIKVSRVRLRVKHLIHASYKSYNRKQVHKFTTIQANFWTEIPKSQTTAKTKLPCRCSNSPILKRTLFQFYISHLNKKKLLIKRVSKCPTSFAARPRFILAAHTSSWHLYTRVSPFECFQEIT